MNGTGVRRNVPRVTSTKPSVVVNVMGAHVHGLDVGDLRALIAKADEFSVPDDAEVEFSGVLPSSTRVGRYFAVSANITVGAA